MPYKAIVSDLDGTLLNREHRLGEYSRQVLRQLHDSGRKIILATGRHYLDVDGIREKVGVPLYLITSNGAQVHAAGGEPLVEHAIPEALVDSLFQMGRQAGVTNHIYKADSWLMEEDDPSLLRFHQDSGFRYRVVDFDAVEHTGVVKFFYSAPHEQLLVLEQRLMKSDLAEQLQIVFSAPMCLEVMAKGVSKGHALQEVLVHKGLMPADVIAFGDGMNDREMLQMAGKGLLMENAMTRLKQQLQHLEVIGHHQHEAVARYLHNVFSLDGC